jgi:predicted alpha/beta superfamily hydrolase
MNSIAPLTEIFQVESGRVGRTMEIIVGSPAPDAGRVRPKLLYVVDPYAYTPAAIDIARALARDREPIVPLIVVGVGTPVRTHQDAVDYLLRGRNGLLVPPEEGINDGIMSSVPGQPAPVANRFLRFIAEELDPLLRQRYEVSPEPAGLFGHSYGGLFSAYALAEQFPGFDRYILASPGALPGRAVLERLVNAATGSLRGRVYLGLGEVEDACARQYEGDLGVAWHRLMKALAPARQPHIELRAEIHSGHGHATAPFMNLARGLRWLYAHNA